MLLTTVPYFCRTLPWVLLYPDSRQLDFLVCKWDLAIGSWWSLCGTLEHCQVSLCLPGHWVEGQRSKDDNINSQPSLTWAARTIPGSTSLYMRDFWLLWWKEHYLSFSLSIFSLAFSFSLSLLVLAISCPVTFCIVSFISSYQSLSFPLSYCFTSSSSYFLSIFLQSSSNDLFPIPFFPLTFSLFLSFYTTSPNIFICHILTNWDRNGEERIRCPVYNTKLPNFSCSKASESSAAWLSPNLGNQTFPTLFIS